MSERQKRISIAALVLAALIYIVLVARFGCDNARASDSYPAGDTVKVAFARSGTLFNGTDEVVGEVLTVFHWQGIVPVDVGTFTEVSVADSGAAGFYFITDSTDVGQYFASWQGTIQGRTPSAVYNFEVVAPPSGPNKVNLWICAASDSSGIPNVDVRIKDETETTLIGDFETDASGKITTALPADTFKVLVSDLGAHSFSLPWEIIVTSSGLTDTRLGTAFNAGSPDSSNVTRIYGWLRALDGSNSDGVIVRVSTLGIYDDVGHDGSDPTILVMQQPIDADTTGTDGYFAVDLLCADELLPHGGSTGNIRHVFEFSKDVRIGPYWITEDDTLYIPCANDSYLYWDSALRP